MFKPRNLLTYITFTAALIVSGCDVKVKPIEGGKEIARELERHKIKRLTQKDILAAAQKAGDSVVTVAQQQLDAKLQAGLQQGGVATAIPYCQPENYTEVQELAHKFGGTPHRTGTRLRNPQNKPDATIAAILAKYEKGQLKEPQVVALNQNELLYTSPIYIRNQNCLQCHGTVGNEITSAAYEKIKQKYPADAAINYKLGELRGMWHITFNKKELVTFLNDQPKKRRRR
ncbi:Tll0287-like domain-containing protein [Pontibacter vulgaris]|uniref:Tll0287-like domain-containing protein n=1 Tax=Pontibacter vulgaris TaxID=2905679 RepID=UPI001FA74E66|nr:DUF3365 domain-containing protein [Pontibacter vulgaris]